MELINNDYIPEDLEIGKKYHINWARKNVRYELKEINGDNAILEHRSGSKVKTPINTLRLTKTDAKRAAKKRLEDEKSS